MELVIFKKSANQEQNWFILSFSGNCEGGVYINVHTHTTLCSLKFESFFAVAIKLCNYGQPNFVLLLGRKQGYVSQI